MATGDPSRPTQFAILDSVMVDEQSQSSYAVGSWSPLLLEPVSPQAIIISTGLQEAMTENKKALERKLQLRRPITQLVEQGIMPPPRTPPAHFKQFKDLERAKTSDILNIKMKNRPERNLLVAQNILPDPKVSPVIVDHQKQLRKAMISNSLNDKLATRPGPLELVEHNILEPSPELKDALKDGTIKYARTCEGEDPRKREGYFPFDELSSSSPESLLSPSDESETTPPVLLPASMLLLASSNEPSEQHAGGGKIRIKKGKSKGPDGLRPKTIKFHEYKGPHLSGKKKKQLSDTELAASESSYNIMLQQQQLFLQWQLQKHGGSKAGSAGTDPGSNGGVSANMPNGVLLPSILNELTVQTLKQELKRRNLNVSGTKTQLVERLRNYLFGSGISTAPSMVDVKCEHIATSPVTAGSTSAPTAVVVSLTPPVQTAPNSITFSPDQIIQMYQQRVQELERELTRHRMGTGPVDTNGAQNVQLAPNGTSLTQTAQVPPSNPVFSEKELREFIRPLQEQRNSNLNSWPIISGSTSGNGHFNGNVLMSSMPQAAKNRLQPVPRDRCQSVEDVLDILIDSGELSPSVKLVSPRSPARSRGARDSLMVEPDNDPMDWLDSALRTPEPWFDTEMRSPAPTLDDGLDPLAIKTPTEAQLAHWDQLTDALLSPNPIM